MGRGDYGDDISGICKRFGVRGTLRLLNKMTAEWAAGVQKIKAACELANGAQRERALRARCVAAAILCQFRSASNFIEFTALRNECYASNDTKNKVILLEKMESVAYAEKENSEDLARLLPFEKSLGFHGEAYGYIYNKEKISRKLEMLSGMLENELLPEKKRLSETPGGVC